jgi:hypothetical protein
MTYKNIILATLLLPSFCAAQTKEEKKLELIFEMVDLMLETITYDDQMMGALWSASANDDELIAETKEECLARAKRSIRLRRQLKELKELDEQA